MGVGHILAGHDTADRDDLLAQRIDDFAAIDHDGVVGVAAVIAVQVHQVDLAVSKPRTFAGGALHPQIQIVRVHVRPRQGDDEFRFGGNVTGFGGLGVHRQQSDDETKHKGDQHVEQHVVERIDLGFTGEAIFTHAVPIASATDDQSVSLRLCQQLIGKTIHAGQLQTQQDIADQTNHGGEQCHAQARGQVAQ